MPVNEEYFRQRKVFLKNCNTNLLHADKSTIEDMIAYLQTTCEMLPEQFGLPDIIRQFFYTNQEEYGKEHIDSRSISIVPGHKLYDEFIFVAGSHLPAGFNSLEVGEENVVRFVIKYFPVFRGYYLIAVKNDNTMEQTVDHVLCCFKI